MGTDDFEKALRIILESLPDQHEGSERRRHAITKADAQVFADMIQLAISHQGCSLNINPELAAAFASVTPAHLEVLKSLTPEHVTLIKWAKGLIVIIIGAMAAVLSAEVNWKKIGIWLLHILGIK